MILWICDNKRYILVHLSFSRFISLPPRKGKFSVIQKYHPIKRTDFKLLRKLREHPDYCVFIKILHKWISLFAKSKNPIS